MIGVYRETKSIPDVRAPSPVTVNIYKSSPQAPDIENLIEIPVRANSSSSLVTFRIRGVTNLPWNTLKDAGINASNRNYALI